LKREAKTEALREGGKTGGSSTKGGGAKLTPTVFWGSILSCAMKMKWIEKGPKERVKGEKKGENEDQSTNSEMGLGGKAVPPESWKLVSAGLRVEEG